MTGGAGDADVVVAISKKLGLGALRSLHQSGLTRVTVVTLDDRSDVGRTAWTEICSFCGEHGLELEVLEGPMLSGFLARRRPDLCLVVGWYWLITQPALDACAQGCLGLHNSLLPAFRGGSPLVWSLIAGDREVGTTLFRMTLGMDEGDVVWQWRQGVVAEDDVGSLLTALERKVTRDLGRVTLDYLSGMIEPHPQSPEEASYAPIRRREDSLVDWRLTSEELERYCRALQPPYPRLFFHWRNEEFEIVRLVAAALECFGDPGRILARTERGTLVKCGIARDGVWLEDVRRLSRPGAESSGTTPPIGARLNPTRSD
jgi:methionyl-tRNA formyltransferase